MMKDKSFPHIPSLFAPIVTPVTYRPAEPKPLSKVLDDETSFSYGYIPFVIAELAWDYADTVINMAIICGDDRTKKDCREIRELRREYERYHDKIVDKEGSEYESSNMIVFEEGVNDIFNLYLVNVRCDLLGKYPGIESDRLDLAVAAYQYLILVKSLLRFSAIQTAKATEIAGFSVGDPMPYEVRRLETVVGRFVKDIAVSEKIVSQQETYIKTFFTQMSLITLNKIDE